MSVQALGIYGITMLVMVGVGTIPAMDGIEAGDNLLIKRALSLRVLLDN